MMLTSSNASLEARVNTIIDNHIVQGAAFTAVDISNILKRNGATNDSGNPVRHRDVNVLVRDYMFNHHLPNNPLWRETTIYPTHNSAGETINTSPNGVIVYHSYTYDPNNYVVPKMENPNSSEPDADDPIISVTSEFNDSDGDLWAFTVKYENSPSPDEIVRQVAKKICSRIPSAYWDESGDLEYQSIDMDDDVSVKIIVDNSDIGDDNDEYANYELFRDDFLTALEEEDEIPAIDEDEEEDIPTPTTRFHNPVPPPPSQGFVAPASLTGKATDTGQIVPDADGRIRLTKHLSELITREGKSINLTKENGVVVFKVEDN